MTGKLEHIVAINTNPLTNPFCQSMHATKGTICASCYSIRFLQTFRQSAIKPYEENSQELSTMDVVPPIINAAFCRLHAYGELINEQHLRNFHAIARKNPWCMFALWTKRIDIVNAVKDKPYNLLYIYSNAIVDPLKSFVPDGFDRMFCVTSNPNDKRINCGGKCIECLKCYNTPQTDNEQIWELLK